MGSRVLCFVVGFGIVRFGIRVSSSSFQFLGEVLDLRAAGTEESSPPDTFFASWEGERIGLCIVVWV